MRYAVLMIVAGLFLGGVVATLGGCAGTDMDICKGSGLCLAETAKPAEPAAKAEPKKDEAAEIEAKAKAEHAKKKAKVKKPAAPPAKEPPKQPLPRVTEDGPPVPLGNDR